MPGDFPGNKSIANKAGKFHIFKRSNRHLNKAVPQISKKGTPAATQLSASQTGSSANNIANKSVKIQYL